MKNDQKYHENTVAKNVVSEIIWSNCATFYGQGEFWLIFLPLLLLLPHFMNNGTKFFLKSHYYMFFIMCDITFNLNFRVVVSYFFSFYSKFQVSLESNINLTKSPKLVVWRFWGQSTVPPISSSLQLHKSKVIFLKGFVIWFVRNCCLKPSQGLGPQIELQPTRWQYSLINYPA